MNTRNQSGIALITVLVLLIGLLMVAAPFALSMRHLESGALLRVELEGARAGAMSAVAAATRHIEDSHPFYDLDTPHKDDLEELHPADLEQRFAGQLGRDPAGAVRSVDVADEQGKVHLPTASIWLLGNLLGGRTWLSADSPAQRDVLDVASTDGFRDAGLLWLEHETVEYSARHRGAFAECRRGWPSNALATSKAREHTLGADVLDHRLLLLAQAAWRLRPGVFDPFRRVDALKDIGLFGEMTYTADEVEAARAFLTVHAGAPAWVAPQRLLTVRTASSLAQVLEVPDGRRYGPGSVVRLERPDGDVEWSLVVKTARWDDVWRLWLYDPVLLDHDDGRSVVRALRREPVNVNTAPMPVLEALFRGLGRNPIADVISFTEAQLLADRLAGQANIEAVADLRLLLGEDLEQGRISLADLAAAQAALEAARVSPRNAGAEELVAVLVGREARRSRRRISLPKARELAARVRAAGPGSHEELRDLLGRLVEQGTITETDREVILRCALDSGDAELSGGTAPFTYASDGIVTVRAGASENLPSGRERARAFVQQVLSVAPPGETAHVLETQADFEDAVARGPGGRGWASQPSLLHSGPGTAQAMSMMQLGALALTTSPQDRDAVMDLVEAYEQVLGFGRQPVSRAQTLLSGRAGPSRDAGTSFLAPRPVRSPLRHTLHFDEGAAGLTARSPKGLDTRDGQVTLALTDIEPDLISSIGRLRRFAVEFWFELEDPAAETILFDGGVGELEDRVLLAVIGGELLFRVHDLSLPDFEADVSDGEQSRTGTPDTARSGDRVPPTGEIRYGFDDGLELRAGVPYHVLAHVGGSSGRHMALWVDGVPRGRRTFTTFLTEEMDQDWSSQTLIQSASGTEMKVDTTSGFPRQGVLRIGHELIEYIDKTDDAFIVGALADGDPFGGRARRHSRAEDHPVSELVELAGYTMPLASEVAALGDGDLGARLGEFTVAELDPGADATSFEIWVEGPFVPGAAGPPDPVLLGTGLGPSATTIPLVQSGSAPLDNGSFSSDGGHALIVALHSLYGGGLNYPGAQPGDVLVFPEETVDGEIIDGVEVIRYGGFTGSALTGCSRAASGIPQATGGPASDLSTAQFRAGGLGTGRSFQDVRVFVTEFNGAVLGASQLPIPVNPRVLVVPISVSVDGGNLWDDFHPYSKTDTPHSHLAQVDLDFGEGDDITEWFRWDTATAGELVRDDEDAVNDLLDRIHTLTLWNPDASNVSNDTSEELNRVFDFRGQVRTRMNSHQAGARVLPVHLLGDWNSTDEMVNGFPGRNDAVTLVNVRRNKDDGSLLTEREWHRINYAARDSFDNAEGNWGSEYLVALRDPVVGSFVRTASADRDGLIEENYATEDGHIDEHLDKDDTGRDRIIRLNPDSRLITRMVKAPSGELPTGPITDFHLGRDFSGRTSPGAAIVDELRFHVYDQPGVLLPSVGTFVLREEIEFEEERQIVLELEELQYPHARRRDEFLLADVLGAVASLPQTGGLLRVGEEIVSYAGIDADDSGSVYLTGRGLFGTERAYHRDDDAVIPLTFWPAEPLSRRLTDMAGEIPLQDASSFPDGPGLVWVDGELIAYTSAQGDNLMMPTAGGRTVISRRGLLRGRFGTAAASHAAGALVRWMPQRFADLAIVGRDVPEAHTATVTLDAPGAFYTGVALSLHVADPTVGLHLRAAHDGQDPHADPVSSPRLSSWDSEGQGDVLLLVPVGWQSDRLDLHLYATWQAGAFDPVRYQAQGWKLAPEVHGVTAAHIQPTLVLEHEEWR